MTAERVDLDALNETERLSADERLWARVEKTATCWIWLGPRYKGYGNLRIGNRWFRAHRYSWMLLRGTIPDGTVLDHLCRVRHCVNPDHLEPVPNGVNVKRGIGPAAINARKTHCKRGHAFTAENTYRAPGGERECRTCRAEYDRQRRARAALTRGGEQP